MEKLTRQAVPVFCAMLLATQAFAGEARLVSVPALGVQGDGLPGVVNYILIQLDRSPSYDGPVVQFNEMNLGGGSRVGDEWKEGVRRAVQAVMKTVGDEGKDWLITIKNRSMTAITDGASASAAVAVGLLAAYRGDALASHIVVSGQITPDGRLDVVGGLPVKIDAAAAAHYRVLVVSRDQPMTADWIATTETAARRRIELVQAETLEEAYQIVTAKER